MKTPKRMTADCFRATKIEYKLMKTPKRMTADCFRATKIEYKLMKTLNCVLTTLGGLALFGLTLAHAQDFPDNLRAGQPYVSAGIGPAIQQDLYIRNLGRTFSFDPGVRADLSAGFNLTDNLAAELQTGAIASQDPDRRHRRLWRQPRVSRPGSAARQSDYQGPDGVRHYSGTLAPAPAAWSATSPSANSTIGTTTAILPLCTRL